MVNWHRAKGLEWPITILLFASRRPRLKDIFGVDIATDQRADDLDLSDPLGGRWIRCWLYPYGSAYKDIPMWDRLGDNPDARQRLEQLQREEVRHLYVTFTRARDRLVLVQTSEELIEGASLELLNPPGASAEGDPVVGELDGETFDWAGLTLPMVTRNCPPAEDLERVVEADYGYALGQPTEPDDLAPAYVQPSGLGGTEPDSAATEVLAPDVLGDPLAVTGKPVWNNLGLALHAFIAADRPSLNAKDRRTIADRLLEGWEVADHLSAQDLITASERLRTWIDNNYPDARLHHEAPVRHRLQSGSIVRGEADLILELPDRFVVIDHKTFRPNGKSLAERQAGYAAQLGAYRDALVAASAGGITTIDTFVHYPLLGQIGRLSS